MQNLRPADRTAQTPQYPPLMADETPASEEAAVPAEPPNEPSAPTERYGIVSISRNRKEDGRNLLLYTREDADQA